MKIYTRTGDDGETGLVGGTRVSKADRRVAAYGEVDELNAVIGVVLASAPQDFARDVLVSIQRDLFGIGAQLATPNPERAPQAMGKATVPEERIGQLEAEIDVTDAALAPLRAFILPGGTAKAANLHHARTVCRRAERHVVAMGADAPPIVIKYLNRLSDLLFTLARMANAQADVRDVEW